MANYVKFHRGSLNAFKNLASKDNDTLYFIYEEDSNESSLYLGDRLIAASKTGAINLRDLLDVTIGENVSDKQFLVYDASESKWVNKSYTEVINAFVGTVGATDGISGLVPAPLKTDEGKFLRADGTWAEVDGFITDIFVDGKSVVLNSNDALMLNDYGVKYYKYVAAEDDVAAHYELQIVDADHPWIAGLEPKVVLEGEELVLGWYEPNPTTIEGVNTQVATLQTTVGSLQNAVANLNSTVGTPAAEGSAATGLHAELDKKANAADVYTTTQTDTKIAEAIAAVDHLSREVVNELPAVEDADANIIYMVSNGLTNDDNKYREYILINGSFEQVGTWEVDLSIYAKAADVTNALDGKVDKAEGYRLMSDAEGTKLAGIAEGADVSLIKEVDNTNFNVSDAGLLTLLDIPQSKVTDLTSTLNSINTALAGKIDAKEGYSLMSDAQAEKLEGIEEGAQKNNITSVSEQLKLENGVLSIVSIASSQITDLAGVLNSKADKSELTALQTTVQDQGNDIAALKAAMTWVAMEELSAE